MNPERPLSTAQLISRIKQGLKKQRPGYRAQLKMGPKPRPGSREIKNGSTAERQAGVLILVYPVEGDLWTVLTQRTERMEHHRGQISFPGGRNEAGETLEQTALREANEELGIPTSDVKIMGRLTPLYIPPSGFCITPTVAYLPRRPEFGS